MALEVLVVDDEADIRELVSGVLEDEGYSVRSAADSNGALEAIDDRRPSLVLLDVWLQGSKLDGLQLLEQIKGRDPTLPVLMISGHGNLDTAVAAIREGAVDFIEKPFKADRLLHLVGRATETDRLRRENATLRQQVGPDDQLDGTSVAINTGSVGSRPLICSSNCRPSSFDPCSQTSSRTRLGRRSSMASSAPLLSAAERTE